MDSECRRAAEMILSASKSRVSFDRTVNLELKIVQLHITQGQRHQRKLLTLEFLEPLPQKRGGHDADHSVAVAGKIGQSRDELVIQVRAAANGDLAAHDHFLGL